MPITPGDSFTVSAKEAAQRLDSLLAARLIDVSRSRIKRAIASGEAHVNGRVRKVSYRVQPGDVISIGEISPDERTITLVAEAIPLDVVFEDDHMLIVNKPRGMVTHPAVGAHSGTLVNALLGYATSLSSGRGAFRPGIIHRLDKDTSGLLVVAKTDAAHARLASALERRHIRRLYLALLRGEPRWETLQVDAAIGRSPADRKKMAVCPDGTSRHALTEFTVRERFPGFTLVEAQLHTGRTHQVRVHAAFAHHPVAGDSTYGGAFDVPRNLFAAARRREIDKALSALAGQALHAYRLELRHPISFEPMSLEAPLPAPFSALVELLRQHHAAE